ELNQPFPASGQSSAATSIHSVARVHPSVSGTFRNHSFPDISSPHVAHVAAPMPPRFRVMNQM
ncbi:unnamed protein product, partial [Boreogadus saida]